MTIKHQLLTNARALLTKREEHGKKQQTEVHTNKGSSAEAWKTVTVRLKENDLAILNNKLQTNGFETFSEFIHAWLKGNYPRYEKNDSSQDLEKKVSRIH